MAFIWINLPSSVGVLVVFSMIGLMLDLTRYDIGYDIKPDSKIQDYDSMNFLHFGFQPICQ